MAAQTCTFQLTPFKTLPETWERESQDWEIKERQQQSYWELESLQTNGKGVGKTKPLNLKPEGRKLGINMLPIPDYTEYTDGEVHSLLKLGTVVAMKITRIG